MRREITGGFGETSSRRNRAALVAAREDRRSLPRPRSWVAFAGVETPPAAAAPSEVAIEVEVELEPNGRPPHLHAITRTPLPGERTVDDVMVGRPT